MYNDPIPFLLHCPLCNTRHVDQGVFATKPHHTHACQQCGHVWRPALVHTVGVQFLPGFKDGEPVQPKKEECVHSWHRPLGSKGLWECYHCGEERALTCAEGVHGWKLLSPVNRECVRCGCTQVLVNDAWEYNNGAKPEKVTEE